jgi:hypothetical protein
MSLDLADLHEIYATVEPTEARLIANLGAEVYVAVRDQLRAAWSADLSAEEGAKADVWRAEGRVSAMEEVRGRLAAAEEATVRAAMAEGSLSALRSAMEGEVARRVAEVTAGVRKDCELAAMKEMAALREQVAVATMREELLVLMQEKVAALEVARAEQMAEKTKSSHVIGKQGEATVWEMLETVVVPEFPYAEARNMAGVSHAADFHLWVMRPDGKRMKVLMDAKKYKRPVNSDEIAKLNTDVDDDEEASCGIMVSLTSPISTMKQFQMKMTDKGKPVLYLSFVDLETEYHARLLCWGVRALMTAVREDGSQSREIEAVDTLLREIVTAVKDLDGVIKTHARIIDSLRSVKNTVMQKITDFTEGLSASDEEEGIVHVNSGCIAVFRATGVRCGLPVVDNGVKCKKHNRRGKE